VKTEIPGDSLPINENGSLSEQPVMRKQLLAIAVRLKTDPVWGWEDLFQEGLLRLWHMQQKRPGQTVSWYLQNADHYLRNLLKGGRSLDSAKRRSGRVESALESDEGDEALEAAAAQKDDRYSMSQIYADEAVEELRCWLNRLDTPVFELLIQDRGTREIALLLRISSRDVIQRCREIAQQAKNLGIGCGRE
jgi:DNA-directed RNA polymerase specialized sigma24 family protein